MKMVNNDFHLTGAGWRPISRIMRPNEPVWTELWASGPRSVAIWLAIALASTGTACAAEMKTSGTERVNLAAYLQGLRYGAVPLEWHRNHLFANGSLDGRKSTLLVDTGASVTSLDKGLFGKFKTVGELNINLVDPVLGRIPSNMVVIRELQLAQARFLNQPAFPAPLKSSSLGYDGLLGCDFLCRQHAIVDVSGKRLFVRSAHLGSEERSALKGLFERSGYHAAPLRRSAGRAPVLICEGRINKLVVKLIVDSGASFTIIDDDTANRCQVWWSGTNKKMVGIGKRGLVPLSSGRPEVFEIGGCSILYPGILIGACDMKSWGLGESIHGVLGTELLVLSEALVDFDGQTLWFRPANANDK